MRVGLYANTKIGSTLFCSSTGTLGTFQAVYVSFVHVCIWHLRGLYSNAFMNNALVVILMVMQIYILQFAVPSLSLSLLFRLFITRHIATAQQMWSNMTWNYR